MQRRDPIPVKKTLCIASLLVVLGTIDTKYNFNARRKWFVGRVPPSSFEYPQLNGFYLPKQAKYICERDLQCGGFTFKGTKNATFIVPEMYFFHFVNESADYLNTEINYPHWTTYVVSSRDYVIISGRYNLKGDNQIGTILTE